jgi:FAD/FMN-containing dehydrogenase
MVEVSSIHRLRETFKGRLLAPDHDDYDGARAVWNGMIDRRPALIAGCVDEDDVVTAVAFARQQGLRISVRCGGHSVAGKAVCEGGLMIDLTAMNKVVVDKEAMTVTVQGGAQLGDVDAATQAFGLATPAGIVSETGVGGLTLGGGVGYLSRRFGLTADNLRSAEMVTADGERIRASSSENPDLFWALRGGGGNFGIVTSFEFRVHELGPEVLVGQAFYRIEERRAVLGFYRDLTVKAPDELAAYALVVNAPPVEPFPQELHGRPVIAIVCCYSADHEEGRQVLAPLEAFGDPVVRFVAPMPFVELQQSFNAGVPAGARYYWKTHFHRELSDEALDTFADNVATLPGPLSIVGFEPMGGAISRVGAQDTAFPHRDVAFALGVWCGWVDPADDEQAIAWARKVHRAMTPFATGGAYSNYLDQDDTEQMDAAFSANLERLQQVKAKFDPDSFFGGNQDIPPAGG